MNFRELLKFLTDILALKERHNSCSLHGFPREAIRECWIRMHAGDGRVHPGSMEWLPTGDEPSVTVFVTGGNHVVAGHLVGLDALVKPRHTLEHGTDLGSQAGQFVVGSVSNPKPHFN